MQAEQQQLKSNAIMKTKLHLQTSGGILILIISLGAALAQSSPNPPPPVAQKAAVAAPVDPATGLPVAQPQPEPQWIDPDWEGGSNMTLTNVSYDNLQVSDVATDLRERFKNTFDILIPPVWRTPTESETMDPEQWTIKLQLKNVNAGEVFRAMNSLFEIQNAPLRWQLTMNGHRPMLLLRVIPELWPRAVAPADAPAPVEPKKPMVFFVGDLIGDEKSGGMTMNQITDTLTEVNKMAYGGDLFIGFHNEAQLVIVRGTDEQIGFVRSTLEALKQKMESTANKKFPDRNRKPEQPKPGDSGGSK